MHETCPICKHSISECVGHESIRVGALGDRFGKMGSRLSLSLQQVLCVYKSGKTAWVDKHFYENPD